MSIEIEILSGDASWPSAKQLYDLVWPAEVLRQLPWGHLSFAHADLRVLLENEAQAVVCHVGIFRREAAWNGRKVRIGGIGGVVTHPEARRRGFASIALTAATQTLKDERATDFAMLFCEPQHADFYEQRGWKRFTGEVLAEQPAGQIRFDVLVPLVFYMKRAPHEGSIDLCGLPW
jgi:aminoglycoside 2'-N-acetyltransferase I